MADKKLITYDCTLSFSFKTKDGYFMNPDFDFSNIRLTLDVANGGSIFLIGNSKTKCPFVLCDLENVFFHCAPLQYVDLSAEGLLKSILFNQDLDSLGGCVFSYQPLNGSRFFLGVKERVFNEKKEIESSHKSEKFPRRCRNKKTELGIQSDERRN